jgi:hypothetical protein
MNGIVTDAFTLGAATVRKKVVKLDSQSQFVLWLSFGMLKSHIILYYYMYIKCLSTSYVSYSILASYMHSIYYIITHYHTYALRPSMQPYVFMSIANTRLQQNYPQTYPQTSCICDCYQKKASAYV